MVLGSLGGLEKRFVEASNPPSASVEMSSKGVLDSEFSRQFSTPPQWSGVERGKGNSSLPLELAMGRWGGEVLRSYQIHSVLGGSRRESMKFL